MDNIVSFSDKAHEIEDVIWKCDCGNCSFILYQDLRIECADCGEFQDGVDMSQSIRKWTRKGEGK